jgi:hypothetical protein
MKKLARILASLSLIILFLPFLQTCSDEVILKTRRGNLIEDSSTQEAVKIKKLRKEYIINGYELGLRVFKKSHKLKDLKDSYVYPLLISPFIITLCILTVSLDFLKKHQTVFQLTLLNLILVVCTLFLYTFSEINVEIEQIKIGYYAFTFNLVTLLIVSRKVLVAEKKLKHS